MNVDLVEPTPIQSQLLPKLAAGHSGLVCAPTQSGKLTGALLAALRLVTAEPRAPQVLICRPDMKDSECVQIQEMLRLLGRHVLQPKLPRKMEERLRYVECSGFIVSRFRLAVASLERSARRYRLGKEVSYWDDPVAQMSERAEKEALPKEFWDNYAHEFYGNYWEDCRELAIEHGVPYSNRQLREIFEELIADHAAGSTLRGRSGISVRGLDKRELFEDGRGSSQGFLDESAARLGPDRITDQIVVGSFGQLEKLIEMGVLPVDAVRLAIVVDAESRRGDWASTDPIGHWLSIDDTTLEERSDELVEGFTIDTCLDCLRDALPRPVLARPPYLHAPVLVGHHPISHPALRC